MALPSHKRTSSSKRRRASHFAFKKIKLASCQKCNEPILPHHACLKCGMYRGREIIKPKTKDQKSKKR